MKKLLTILAGVAFVASFASCKKCSECKATSTTGATLNETKQEFCGTKGERADFNYAWEQTHPSGQWTDVKCSDLK